MGSARSKMFNFMDNPLIELAAVDFGIQFCVFVASAFLKTEKFYDLTGNICDHSYLCIYKVKSNTLFILKIF